MLQGFTLKYSFNRVKTQIKAIERGSIHKQLVIEQNTQWPNQVNVGLARAAAVTGDFRLTPFKFSSLGINRIELQLDRMVEEIAYTPTDQPAKSYCKLASMLDRNESGHSFWVSFDKLKSVNNPYASILLCWSFLRGVPLIQRGNNNSQPSVQFSSWWEPIGSYRSGKQWYSAEWFNHSYGESSVLWTF